MIIRTAKDEVKILAKQFKAIAIVGPRQSGKQHWREAFFLLCLCLLGINKLEQLSLHPLKGSLFENYVIGELIKDRYNKNILFDLYFLARQ